jgi:hypothetical protein
MSVALTVISESIQNKISEIFNQINGHPDISTDAQLVTALQPLIPDGVKMSMFSWVSYGKNQINHVDIFLKDETDVLSFSCEIAEAKLLSELIQ